MSFTVPTFKVKSPRRMPPELDAIITAKALEIDADRCQVLCESQDPLGLADLAADALVALKIREKTNQNDGFLVELVQKVTGGKKGDAWCVQFGQAAIAWAELRTGIVSEFPRTASCATTREYLDGKYKHMRIPMAQSVPGTQWVKQYRNASGKFNGKGHHASFTGWIRPGVSANLNEGNTTAGKLGEKTVREGGGSYFTARNIRDVDGEWTYAYNPFPVHLAGEKKQPFPIPATVYPKFGERSDAVASLQRALNSKGEKLKVDADFGPKTRAALTSFQLHAKVGKILGEMDEATAKALGLE